MRIPISVAYGGGVNSTAMAIGLVERQAKPDVITFANTKAEKPETYANVKAVSAWLEKQGFPCIVTVEYECAHDGLEDECLKSGTLPAIVYGKRGCSDKWKQRPQHRFLKSLSPFAQCWAEGGKAIKMIGYGYDERHRAAIAEDSFYRYLYPLIEWGWTRKDCIEACHRYGFDPPKSACFF